VGSAEWRRERHLPAPFGRPSGVRTPKHGFNQNPTRDRGHHPIISLQQTANSKQQTANSKQQTANQIINYQK
jgi:hypothetical protein